MCARGLCTLRGRWAVTAPTPALVSPPITHRGARMCVIILLVCLLAEGVHSQGQQGRGRQGNRRKQGKKNTPQDGGLIPTPAPSPVNPAPIPQTPPTVPCNIRNKCEKRGEHSLSFHALNCFCDELCQVYDDCCKDFTPSAAPISFRVPKRGLDCIRDVLLHKEHEVYIVNRCSKGYEDSLVRDYCENDSSSDRFLHLPVSGRTSHVLYRNFYCAVCSGETDMLFWRPKLSCGDNPLEQFEGGENGTQQVARETLDDSLSEPGKHGCRVEQYVHPTDPTIKPRRCKSNFDKCDRSWKDKSYEKKCKKFTSYVYVHLKAFKNKYCGICNYVNETYLSCEDMRTPPECPYGECHLPPPAYHPPPLAILLDINTGIGKLESSRPGVAGSYEVTETVVETRRCPVGMVHDPFTRVCRLLYCPGGTQFHEGRCIPGGEEADDSDNRELSTVGDFSHQGTVIGGEVMTTESAYDPDRGLGTVTESIPLTSPRTTTTTTTTATTTTQLITTTTATTMVPTTTTRRPRTTTTAAATTTIKVIYTTNPTDRREKWYQGGDDLTTDKSKDSQTGMTKPEAIQPPSVPPGGVTLDCPMVAYNKSEYHVLRNLSIVVLSLQRVYPVTEYIASGTVVFICAPYFERDYNVTTNVTYTVIMFKFSRIQSLLSFVGMLISLVALLILVVIYLVLPPLRNMPGKCVISLAVSLFFAQLIFLTGSAHKFTDMPPVCLSMGAVMHYFFLVAFFWMNVLAIDISRTFVSATPRNPTEPGAGRFAVYSLYAWLVPAVIVGGAIALDFYGDAVDWLETLRPYYGDGLCWITKREALLYLFAVPLALLLFINIILFGVTIKHIISISRAAKAAVKQDKERGRFILYIKLTVIMGLTWIFGFLAALTDYHVLWYVFIVLNTLQGAFICFAFVCTRRVFRLLSEKGRVHRSTDVTSDAIGNGRYGNYSSTRYGQYTRPTQYFETQSKVISQETSI